MFIEEKDMAIFQGRGISFLYALNRKW